MHIKQFVALFVTLILLLHINKIAAQCCSGNPVVGSTNVGILTKHNLRIISFYRYNYSDAYYDNNQRRSDIQYLKYTNYHYAGGILAFGITSKFTAEAEFGYYIQKMEILNVDPLLKVSSAGLNNGVVSLKYGIFKKAGFECTIGAGLKFPFSTELQKDNNGNILSVTLQPSTNAYGGVFQLYLQKFFEQQKLRVLLIHRTETNAYNIMYYMRGIALTSSLFLSRPINDHWSAILQIRNEYRQRDYLYDQPVNATGAMLFFVAPQINYSIKKINFSLLGDLPLYRNVNEKQITSKYAISFIITKDFQL